MFFFSEVVLMLIKDRRRKMADFSLYNNILMRYQQEDVKSYKNVIFFLLDSLGKKPNDVNIG